MRVAALLSLLAVLADTPVTVPAQMRLKDGTVYDLKAPPYLKNGRFVFTTHDGKVLSLAEVEVDEIKLLPPSAPGKAAPNPHDSRQLGAIAREQRRTKGSYTLLAPAPTPRPKKVKSR
jgi:hypothetical protein